MKTNLLTIFLSLAIVAPVSAADSPAQTKLRRQPYKEVRTKHNQDPVVREALRLRREQEQKQRIEERKRIAAQVDHGRRKTATESPVSRTNTFLPASARAVEDSNRTTTGRQKSPSASPK